MKFAQTFVFLASLLLASPLAAAEYDPLHLPEHPDVQTTDLTVHDAKRNRDIPIRIYLPAGGPLTPGPSPREEPRARGDKNSRGAASALPVVLFSHGLGGNREGSAFLGKHWAARGYAAVFLQHPGSDESVWKNQPPLKRMAAMKQAASAENFLLRVQDVPAVLDQLQVWNQSTDPSSTNHELSGRLDQAHVGMSGHSFGAQTTQGVAGQSVPLVGQRYTDKRIKAAVIMSPGLPRSRTGLKTDLGEGVSPPLLRSQRKGGQTPVGFGDPKTAFADVRIPWLLMTGTKDTAAIGGQTVESRLAVFPALPAGNHYELVLAGAEHSAFTERALPGDKAQRNPNHHRAILAISTAFWDTYLRNDDPAKSWLVNNGPRSILETEDRWQKK